MENKENVRRHNSKIPVAVKRHGSVEDKIRDPLKTLASQRVNHAGPSRGVDLRHVTHRNNQELDWKFKVFNDAQNPDGIFRQCRLKEKQNSTECAKVLKQKDCKPGVKLTNEKDSEGNTLVEDSKDQPRHKDPQETEKYHHKDTPASLFCSHQSTPLQLSTLKKVKSSLKRFHSRELASLTPVLLSLPSSTSNGVPKRISSSSEIEKEDFLGGSRMDDLNQDYTGDVMQYLLTVEKKLDRGPVIRRISRSCVVNWIIKVNSRNNNKAVVQLACWYLDNYLSSVWVPVDRLQLVAAACYWLATKLHGGTITSSRLLRCSSYAFSPTKLIKAERTVVRKLKYSMQHVIPNDFVPYLSWWCDSTGDVEAAASFLCLCGVLVSKTLCEEYPSVVAAAAVKNALMLLGKDTLMSRLEDCPLFQAAQKKTKDFSTTCTHLRDNVRVLASVSFEYKAPILQYSAAPNFIAPRVIQAVYSDELMILDKRFRRNTSPVDYFR